METEKATFPGNKRHLPISVQRERRQKAKNSLQTLGPGDCEPHRTWLWETEANLKWGFKRRLGFKASLKSLPTQVFAHADCRASCHLKVYFPDPRHNNSQTGTLSSPAGH